VLRRGKVETMCGLMEKRGRRRSERKNRSDGRRGK
jgi:hypothetical protein